jgi:hypothetical protein
MGVLKVGGIFSQGLVVTHIVVRFLARGGKGFIFFPSVYAGSDADLSQLFNA